MRTRSYLLLMTAFLLVWGTAYAEKNAKSGSTTGGDEPASGSSLVPNYSFGKQGFELKLQLNNVGAMGRVAFPPFRANPNPPADSIGCEYPSGSNIEHIYGGGLWIGGLIDTARVGTSPKVKGVTLAYEGWSGPYYEFFPGDTPGDTIWKIPGKNAPKPADWDAYWGGAVPYHPISDNDYYCTYTDTAVAVNQHVPLRLKVIQSSYTWADPYAEALLIIEYRIINMWTKTLDSAYVGFFVDADVGPVGSPNTWQRNFTGYYSGSKTAYIHNPIDRGSTPVGVTLLSTPFPLDSIDRYTFDWFPGPQSPTPDAARYDRLSSGQIRPDEYPNLSDTRFLFGFGPFTIRSRTDPNPDTLKIAVAVVSGFSRTRDPRIIMQRNAARALDIYLNQGIQLPATPPSPPLRATVGFRRIELDWRWRPGDDVLFGRGDPELNWDSTNQKVARRYPWRYESYVDNATGKVFSVPPGYDSTRGGRNFSAFRVWRSEHPDYPRESFTLLKQYDEPRDSFEFNTGLEFTLVDSNLVRGKTYVYSVTSLSIPNVAESRIRLPSGQDTTIEVPVEPLESSVRDNAFKVDLPFAVSNELGKVSVVPNPYRTDRDFTLESGGYEGPRGRWNENERLIKFINLPARCTIRIFSLSGDLVKTVEHDGGSGVFPRGDVNVPLLSESNRALASGVYLFTVDSEFGVQTGKFVIIR